jgi:hypothetical protein
MPQRRSQNQNHGFDAASVSFGDCARGDALGLCRGDGVFDPAAPLLRVLLRGALLAGSSGSGYGEP